MSLESCEEDDDCDDGELSLELDEDGDDGESSLELDEEKEGVLILLYTGFFNFFLSTIIVMLSALFYVNDYYCTLEISWTKRLNFVYLYVINSASTP